MKAKSVGPMAEDYTTDHVSDLDSLYTGSRFMESVEQQLIDQLYAHPAGVIIDGGTYNPPLKPNEYLIMKNGQGSVLAMFSAADSSLKKIDKLS
jgi:PhoH-like ATPase